MGNDRSDSRTTASKFNTSHPNVDLLHKSQPFTDCFNNKNKQYMRYCKSCLGKSDNTVGLAVRFIQINFVKDRCCGGKWRKKVMNPWLGAICNIDLESFHYKTTGKLVA